jgi:hypothetical protein
MQFGGMGGGMGGALRLRAGMHALLRCTHLAVWQASLPAESSKGAAVTRRTLAVPQTDCRFNGKHGTCVFWPHSPNGRAALPQVLTWATCSAAWAAWVAAWVAAWAAAWVGWAAASRGDEGAKGEHTACLSDACPVKIPVLERHVHAESAFAPMHIPVQCEGGKQTSLLRRCVPCSEATSIMRDDMSIPGCRGCSGCSSCCALPHIVWRGRR